MRDACGVGALLRPLKNGQVSEDVRKEQIEIDGDQERFSHQDKR
jgi:hypothetical protein